MRGSDLKSSNFPSQQTEKKRVSLAILFMFLPLPKFKLLNLLHFHLYTCKTTLFLVFAVVQWVVFISLRDLGFTTDGFSYVPSNVQLAESTAWHASRGKCRKGAEQQQPGCKLQLDSLPVCQLDGTTHLHRLWHPLLEIWTVPIPL